MPTRPIKEREIVDLDTSDKSLNRVMEQVDENSTEYQASVQKLLGPELTRTQLKEMNSLLEPVIVAPEMMSVSTTPFLMGASTQVEVVLSEAPASHEDPLRYLGLQVLGWLLAGMLTAGFILLMKKMSQT